MGITPHRLFLYFKALFKKPSIVKLFQNATFKQYGSFRPKFNIIPTCGSNVGALTSGASEVEVSSWVLKDVREAKSVVRHEVAHLLHSYFQTGGTAHGKEYIQWLKMVSPNTWRRDRHFKLTTAIRKARDFVHPSKGVINTVPLLQHRRFQIQKSLV